MPTAVSRQAAERLAATSSTRPLGRVAAHPRRAGHHRDGDDRVRQDEDQVGVGVRREADAVVEDVLGRLARPGAQVDDHDVRRWLTSTNSSVHSREVAGLAEAGAPEVEPRPVAEPGAAQHRDQDGGLQGDAEGRTPAEKAIAAGESWPGAARRR